MLSPQRKSLFDSSCAALLLRTGPGLGGAATEPAAPVPPMPRTLLSYSDSRTVANGNKGFTR